MKIVLAIFCSLMLVWAQATAASAPATSPAAYHCGCGGKLACCKAASTPIPQPLPATAQLGSQTQLLILVPATVVWVRSAAGTPAISPVVSPSLTTGSVPLFARICVRLI